MGKRINRVIFQLHKIGFKPALLFQFKSREDLVLRNMPENPEQHNQILLSLQSFGIRNRPSCWRVSIVSFFIFLRSPVPDNFLRAGKLFRRKFQCDPVPG